MGHFSNKSNPKPVLVRDLPRTPTGAPWSRFNRWYWGDRTLDTIGATKRWQEEEKAAPLMEQAFKLLTEAKGSRTWKELCEKAGVDYGQFRNWRYRQTLMYADVVAKLLMSLGLPVPWRFEKSLAEVFRMEAWERNRKPL